MIGMFIFASVIYLIPLVYFTSTLEHLNRSEVPFFGTFTSIYKVLKYTSGTRGEYLFNLVGQIFMFILIILMGFLSTMQEKNITMLQIERDCCGVGQSSSQLELNSMAQPKAPELNTFKQVQQANQTS